jgi:hypothetical protein
MYLSLHTGFDESRDAASILETAVEAALVAKSLQCRRRDSRAAIASAPIEPDSIMQRLTAGEASWRQDALSPCPCFMQD